MKKVFLFGIATFLSSMLYSNPNPDPEIHINEFMFTGQNSWNLELYFYYCDLSNFDRITLQSGSDTAIVINFRYDQFYYFTDQDLSQPLTINPTGDVIVLTGYYGYYSVAISCQFAFGNVPNPNVVSPLPGQSVERFEHINCYYPYFPSMDVFTISNHPTMGLLNDTAGTCGTLQGIVFDQAGHPVADQIFQMDFPFTTDASGHFSTPVYSRIFSWDTICYQRWPGFFTWVKTAPISYTMVPDSVITSNISLLTPIIVGDPPNPKNSGSSFNVFPNPVTDVLTVSYTTDLAADPGDLQIDIYDMNGNMVLKKDLKNRLGVVNIPVDLPNGIYVAILSGEGKSIGSARFIVNKAE